MRALSQGQVSRRELLKWGIFTGTGALALTNGLSPFASSAYGSIPTGAPPSPLFGAKPFTHPMPRLDVHKPRKLKAQNVNGELEASFPKGMEEPNAKRVSWHTDFTASGGTNYINPTTGRGPWEGRPPGEWFAHQRWNEYFPEVAYRMSLGRVKAGTKFHPSMPDQAPNSVWSLNEGGLGKRGILPPPLIKMRYGEPAVVRFYNNLPLNRANNNGFGRNEASTHNHNAHNNFASDGACNAYHLPGTFYDYHWTTTLARADMINRGADDPRASGPDGNGGLMRVPGDFRELQGSLWFHDHRFFFTAENVYKGHVGMLNYYSGPDRGNEELVDGVNLRLPSGRLLDWGNIDFDVNLIVSDFATSQDGQLFFDIFDTDGFLGDNLLVNFAYSPFHEVLPRKYRLRILNACMSRFIKLVLVNQSGTEVPVQVIANDGNLLVNPITVNKLDIMGTGERFDIVVDFSQFSIGDKITLVNVLEHKDGRGPEEPVAIRKALNRRADDPAVAPVMEFRIVGALESVDVPGVMLHWNDPDLSQVPAVLTEQIPIVEPVRTREIEFKRGGDLSLDCFPECGGREGPGAFPWTIRINGETTHYLNANRVSLVVPKPGEVEHWTLVNGGGGWDHPVHLHFEEGVTINRGGDSIPATEKLARKDVWRLREGGKVKIQVRFGEHAGAYVMHCHNTVHEDAAMLMRYQILKENDGSGNPLVAISPTPRPTEDGVEWETPEVLREGDPRRRSDT